MISIDPLAEGERWVSPEPEGRLFRILESGPVFTRMVDREGRPRLGGTPRAPWRHVPPIMSGCWFRTRFLKSSTHTVGDTSTITLSDMETRVLEVVEDLGWEARVIQHVPNQGPFGDPVQTMSVEEVVRGSELVPWPEPDTLWRRREVHRIVVEPVDSLHQRSVVTIDPADGERYVMHPATLLLKYSPAGSWKGAPPRPYDVWSDSVPPYECVVVLDSAPPDSYDYMRPNGQRVRVAACLFLQRFRPVPRPDGLTCWDMLLDSAPPDGGTIRA